MVNTMQAKEIKKQNSAEEQNLDEQDLPRKRGVINSPLGFTAAGDYVGIKKKVLKDLAIIVSEVPAKVAAVFTQNVVKAAPVLWNQAVVEKNEEVCAVVVNSGNANACTGVEGAVHTQQMAEAVAKACSVDSGKVLVASTGVIGVPLKIDVVEAGIAKVASQLSKTSTAGHDACEAIMTTDTFCKEFSVQFELGGKQITIAGMAKGSGMIHPNMATMLGFVTTDANISVNLLRKALSESVKQSFNMISVDGDTSTNDMLIALANGMAGNTLIAEENEDYKTFFTHFNNININLAKSIAQDGEGATKLLEVTVSGAASQESAQKLAKSVISSSLVKAAFFGQDANWGRILSALGNSGVMFNPGAVSIQFVSAAGTVTLMKAGQPLQFDEEEALSVLKEKNISILVEMSEGNAKATAWGCDLSYDYVKINGSYRT
jgi:glutamate N-acetyltransferase/amino-acid N-acetyltransferase